jgi:hypothetical protein
LIVEGVGKEMNIGLGLVLIPVAIILLLIGLFSHKNNNKILGYGILVVGISILSICVLLLTGIYDPYANHIR